MRPIQLKMTAFGPYKSTETVNFEELGDHQLFVISGATGAGKTTIFDGICFALYGQASGEDRTDVRAMRSHFAEGDVQTTVELTFAIQQHTYRVMRTIPYVKEGNKSETAGSVELFMKKDEAEVPVVDRQIVSEVNEKVIEILGFTQPQFSQIVMLPQGEFRKFLTSSTENKEEIMRKIFKTDPYRGIVDRLKVKRDEAQAALEIETKNNASYVDKIAASLPERESSLLYEVLAAEHANTNQIIEGLEVERAYYEEKTKRDQEQYNTAFKQHSEMLSKFHNAKDVNNRFVELEQYKAALHKLSERLPEMERKEERLTAAERTIVIEQLDVQYTDLKKEVAVKETVVQKVKTRLQEMKAKWKQTEETYEAEENKEEEREQLAESLIGLKNMLPSVSELALRKDKVITLEKKTAALQAEVEIAIKAADDENEKMLAFQKEIDKLEEETFPLDQLTDELNEIQEKSRIVEGYLEEKRQAAIFDETQKIHLLNYEKVQEQYDQLADSWLMSEAATLAEMLHEGEQCPVCGSTEHPEKAHQTAGTSNVSKEELEEAKTKLTEVEGRYRKAVADYDSAADRLAKQAHLLADAGVELDGIEETSTQHKERIADLDKEQKYLRKSREALAQLKQKLKQQREITEVAIEKKASSEKRLADHKLQLDTERSVYEHALQAIPEDVRDLPTLEKRIEQLNEKKIEMDRAWQKIQQLRQDDQKAVTEAELNDVHAKNALSEVEKKAQMASDRFYAVLAESEFPTEEAYREAKMEEPMRAALKKELEQFKQARHTAQKMITELTKKLEGKERMDLAILEASLENLKEVYEQALNQVNDSKDYERRASELKRDLLASTERIAQLEQKFGKIAELHDVVRGQNEARLSFERYIQIEYLERIIQSANERLMQLSNGQFEFMRSDRQEKNRRQSGLSLDVYDAYTGQTRDVKTLSGGEKFNASLCLALGMSDVIQSFQGSVSVDTMFIDEGFGSLDEESLNKAIDTLIELQKAGRMIGVISHVEELKAAFPAILEVTKSKEGHSETNFLVK